ncbi:unnamed protein product [Parajaminaea phylloscopi]
MPLFKSSAERDRGSRSTSSSWSLGQSRGLKAAPRDAGGALGGAVDWQALGKELGDLLTAVNPMSETDGSGSSSRRKGKRISRDKKRPAPPSGDLLAVLFATAANLSARFFKLDPRTQVTVSWILLVLSIFCVSGLWTIKIAAMVFLFLFKPVADAEASASKASKEKPVKPKKQRDASGAFFSDDPLVAALQRIPETFTYGNIAPASASDSPPSQNSSEPTSPKRRSRALPPLSRPLSVVKDAAPQAAVPPEVPEKPATPTAPRASEAAEAAPGQSKSSSPSEPAAAGDADDAGSGADSASQDESSSTRPVAGSGPNGWQRGASGSFHRIEVAKKAWRRTFSSSTAKDASMASIDTTATAETLPEFPSEIAVEN